LPERLSAQNAPSASRTSAACPLHPCKIDRFGGYQRPIPAETVIKPLSVRLRVIVSRLARSVFG
jgi:hypothetical protein